MISGRLNKIMNRKSFWINIKFCIPSLFFFSLIVCMNFCKKTPTSPSALTTTTSPVLTTTTSLSNTTTSIISNTSTTSIMLTSSTSSSISPVTTTVLASNGIALHLDPLSGTTNAIIQIKIYVNENSTDISAFGLELSYNTAMFSYVGTEKGNLTSSWGTVDANEPDAGTIRLGGFSGGSPAIPNGSKGYLAIIKLIVTCSGCSNGQQIQLCISNYTDDIKNMIPNPNCSVFTFTK